uniref:Uncharacterized protein n=1 Tax=Vitis vinifera TaxID=29760 RepID=F6I1J6_VITVI
MKSNTLLCDLSFYGLHSISEAIGIMEIHIKHRYQRVVGTDTREGEEMPAEDVVSPKVVRVFGVPVQVLHLPLLRQLYVSNFLASLELGSTVFKYLIPRTTSFMEEVVERSGGHGFWMVVEVDVRTIDREDVVELREMEGGDEDDYGDGDEDEDEDEDCVRLAVD